MNKFWKEAFSFLRVIALFWCIAFALYWFGGQRGWLDPAPVQNNVVQTVDDYAWYRDQLRAWSWSLLPPLVVLLGLGIIYRFFYVPGRNSREGFDLAANGLWVPRERNTTPWSKRINPFNHEHHNTIHDPNMQAVPIVRSVANGTLSVEGDTAGVPLQEQMEFAHNVSSAHRISAMQGTARNGGGSWFGSSGNSRQGRGMNMSEARMLTGVFDEEKRVKQLDGDIKEQKLIGMQPTADVEAITPNDMITLDSALQSAQQSPGIIQLGQSDNAERTIATLNLNVTPHVAVFGGTNSGKTSNAAFTIALAALIWKWPVIVFEFEDKNDWRLSFGDHIEHYVVNGDTVMDALEIVAAENSRRTAILRDMDVRDYRECDGMKPWLFVFEEFGSTRRHIKATRTKKAGNDATRAFDMALGNLMSTGRNTGLHALYVDQYPEEYDRPVRVNIGTSIVYKLGDPNLGSAAGSPKNYRLDDQGQFDIRKVAKSNGEPIFFNSFLCTKNGAVERHLSGIPKRLPLLDMNTVSTPFPSVSSTVSDVSAEVSSVSGNGQKPDLPERNGETFPNSGGGNSVIVPPSLTRNWKRYHSIDEAVKSYRETYANGTQAELRQWLSALDGTRVPDSFKKQVSIAWREL